MKRMLSLRWRAALGALLVGMAVLPAAPEAGAATRKKATVVKPVKQQATVKKKALAPTARAPKAALLPSSSRSRAGRVDAGARGAGGATRALALAGVAAGGAALAQAHDDAPGVDGLRLHSNAVLVMDADTQAVLLGKNDDAVLPIASITKLMTAIVVVDAGLPMDEVLTITEDDVDRLKGSGSRLAVGTRLTRAEALHLALMASENRAAHALGRTYPGGVDAFVAAMNNKAAELGLTQTRFAEPTGLSSDNRSSPRDLARLVAQASARPALRQWTTSPEYELADGRRVLHYRNSNKLVRESDWDILVQKTGYIREAGRCVAMQVRLAGRNIIMVLMNAGNSAARWADAEQLLRWLEKSLPSHHAGGVAPRL